MEHDLPAHAQCGAMGKALGTYREQLLCRWSEKRHDRVIVGMEKNLNFKGVWGK
jgi:hypothetical protein